MIPEPSPAAAAVSADERPCPRCQVLVPGTASRCPDCGTSLLGVSSDIPVLLPPNRGGWLAWGIGFPVAIVVGLLPILGYMAWFMASLCHEMGHSAAAMLTGSLAVPAIRLDGHAAAASTDPIFLARFVIWAALIAWASRIWRRGGSRAFAIALVVCYPLLAWPAREVFRLYSGQFGELLFASVFLWRAWTGGFTESPLERPLYAILGWILVQRNLVLSWGLITSDAARAEYWSNGSFGIPNDLLRIAHDHLGIALSTAAIPLLLGTLATPLAAWWTGRWWLRQRAAAS
jgi:hypothetical protein